MEIEIRFSSGKSVKAMTGPSGIVVDGRKYEHVSSFYDALIKAEQDGKDEALVDELVGVLDNTRVHCDRTVDGFVARFKGNIVNFNVAEVRRG